LLPNTPSDIVDASDRKGQGAFDLQPTPGRVYPVIGRRDARLVNQSAIATSGTGTN